MQIATHIYSCHFRSWQTQIEIAFLWSLVIGGRKAYRTKYGIRHATHCARKGILCMWCSVLHNASLPPRAKAHRGWWWWWTYVYSLCIGQTQFLEPKPGDDDEDGGCTQPSRRGGVDSGLGGICYVANFREATVTLELPLGLASLGRCGDYGVVEDPSTLTLRELLPFLGGTWHKVLTMLNEVLCSVAVCFTHSASWLQGCVKALPVHLCSQSTCMCLKTGGSCPSC